MAETVAFVGLGRMGRPMLRRLAEAGFWLSVYDVQPAAVADAARHRHVTAVSALTDLATAGVLVLMLPSSAEVEDVLIGQGLLGALSAGTTVIRAAAAARPRRSGRGSCCRRRTTRGSPSG